MGRSRRDERFGRQPEDFTLFDAGQAVEVYMADHWESGTVSVAARDRVEVRVAKRKAPVIAYDARNVVPAGRR
jgi:hypothetical protein